MTTVKNPFIYIPGGENENGGAASDDKNEQEKEKIETPDVKEETEEETEEEKPLGEKIKEALQDWSNKDQADQDFDDTRV